MPANRAARERWAYFARITMETILDLEMHADRLKAKLTYYGTNLSLLALHATTMGAWMTKLTTQYQTHVKAIKKTPDQVCEHVNDKGEPTTKPYHAGRHGWFTRCALCGARWKWNKDHNEWQYHPDQVRIT